MDQTTRPATPAYRLPIPRGEFIALAAGLMAINALAHVARLDLEVPYTESEPLQQGLRRNRAGVERGDEPQPLPGPHGDVHLAGSGVLGSCPVSPGRRARCS